jgi:hypothetical protein
MFKLVSLKGRDHSGDIAVDGRMSQVNRMGDVVNLDIAFF